MPIPPRATRLLRKENADGLPVLIEELSGDKETLVLAGRDRPDAGIELENELRYTKEYYPGAQEATIHIQGLIQSPIELKGRFFDEWDLVGSFGGFGTSVTNPIVGGSRLKANFVHNIHARKSRCRLSWGDNWDIEGYISKVKTKEYRHQDIGYEITFEPVRPYNDDASDDALFTDNQQRMAGFLDNAEIIAGSLTDLFTVFYKVNKSFIYNGAPIDIPGNLPGGF